MDREPRHGTTYEYRTYGCRCDLCRAAGTSYTRELRRRNTAAGKKRMYSTRDKDRRKDKININKTKAAAILVKSGCVLCGELDLAVLDFDHLDPSTKINSICKMYSSSWKRIEAEIAKCQVLCANCHRRKTAKDQGWRKMGYQF